MFVQLNRVSAEGTQNLIDEIKMLRDFCWVRYGHRGSLKTSKDLIDSIYEYQSKERADAKHLEEAKDAFIALTPDQRQELANYFGWGERR